MVVKRKMANHDEELSLLGMGAMRLPVNQAGNVLQAETNAMVDLLMSNGVNYYDTAPVYLKSESEKALGIALARYPRKSYNVADKMPLWLVKSLQDRDRLFQESLERMGLEYFDFYLMHAMNQARVEMLKKWDFINWIIQKKKEGKIRYAGFSIHAPFSVLIELLNLYDWDFVQIQLNYMDHDDDPGYAGYQELLKRKKTIIIMEPVKGGTLANLSKTVGAPFKALKSTASDASYGYRYMMDMQVNVILSGVSNVAQVKDNLKTFAQHAPLSSLEYQAIAQVKENINRLQKVNCTGCRYCMPCPFGVDIPENFSEWNNWSMYQESYQQMVKDYRRYMKFPQGEASAANCQKCGKCKIQCPQHIDIPTKLAELEAYKKEVFK